MDGIKRISQDKANDLSSHKLEFGDVLLPRRGDLTKLGYVHPAQDGWVCGTGTIRVRLPEARGRRLLFYALSRPSVTKWLERNAVGTTMPNLNSSIVGNIEISWPQRPDLAEKVIGEADALIHSLNGYHQAAKQLLSRIITEIF